MARKKEPQGPTADEIARHARSVAKYEPLLSKPLVDLNFDEFVWLTAAWLLVPRLSDEYERRRVYANELASHHSWLRLKALEAAVNRRQDWPSIGPEHSRRDAYNRIQAARIEWHDASELEFGVTEALADVERSMMERPIFSSDFAIPCKAALPDWLLGTARKNDRPMVVLLGKSGKPIRAVQFQGVVEGLEEPPAGMLDPTMNGDIWITPYGSNSFHTVSRSRIRPCTEAELALA